MPSLSRSRLVSVAIAVALAGGLSACASDDAVERDARDAGENIDRGVGNADEKARDAAEGARDAVEKGIEDIDGR